MSTYARNKKASFNYEVLKKIEAGIQLYGYEVKAVRKGSLDLTGAFVVLRGEEAYLTNAHISPYQPANIPKNYTPERSRKLLLRKKELRSLIGTAQQKGLTILPLRMYNKGDKIKVEIGIARGKRKYEKREILKKRAAQREIEKRMKNF